MLKYIVMVTEDLLILATLISLLYAYCGMVWQRKGHIALWVGIGTGLLLSAAMAVVKNTTNLIYTNQWNMWIFSATMMVTLLFVIFSCIFGRNRLAPARVGGGIVCVLAAALAALLIFYEIPDVMAYPALFDTAGKGIISVEFLVRLIGWMAALVLACVFMRCLYRCAVALHRTALLLVIVNLAALTNALRCLGQMLRPWLTRAKWLPDFLPTYSKADYPWAFPFTAFVANNTLLFTVAIAGIALLIPLLLYLRNLRITAPYHNPAQHRKLKSVSRRNRRIGLTVVVCFALAVVNLTLVKAYDSRVIELSPPEHYTIADDHVYIPLAELDDGHLHRYEYVTERNVAIRWIIIRKPGSASYGVGLDACEVCGVAGYYERSGQVICKRCDVVMNINTIGFRGGCNPIPLDYRVADGQLMITIQALLDGEKEFR